MAWKAQHRLNKRYKTLTAKGKNKNQIVTAIARELCRVTLPAAFDRAVPNHGTKHNCPPPWWAGGSWTTEQEKPSAPVRGIDRSFPIKTRT
jgi:hypothetical protein